MKRLISILSIVMVSLGISALDVNHLRVMSEVNPVCVDATRPDFSWQLLSDERGVMQTSYRIVVSSDAEGGNVVWDSGTVESDQSANVPADGITLSPSTRYYWRVTVTDNKGNEATSDETAYFETGLMKSGWSGAQWIKASDRAYGDDGQDNEILDYTVEGKVRIERTAAGL